MAYSLSDNENFPQATGKKELFFFAERVCVCGQIYIYLYISAWLSFYGWLANTAILAINHVSM